MDETDARLRRMARRSVMVRLAVIVWCLVLFPALLLLFQVLFDIDTSTDPVFFGVCMGLGWVVYLSGQSWKKPDRVRALLDEGEEAIVVLPVRRPATPLPLRLLHGCFIVLTERRVLVFAYNKLLDTPTGILWGGAADSSSAVSKAAGRLLTIESSGMSMEFTVTERHRGESARLVQALCPAQEP